MKKLLLLAMTLLLIVSVCACGSSETVEESSSMPEISAVESITPTPTPPPVDVKVVISGDGVNVRAAANLDCEIYGMAVNEAFYLVEEDDGSGFHKILYGDKEAYIYAEYCEIKTMTEDEAEALVLGETAAVSGEESETIGEEEEESTVSINSEDGQRR